MHEIYQKQGDDWVKVAEQQKLDDYYTKTEADAKFVPVAGGKITGKLYDEKGAPYLPIYTVRFGGYTDANGFLNASDIGVDKIPIGFKMDTNCDVDPILYLFISSSTGAYHRTKCMSWDGAGLNKKYVAGTIYYINVGGL